MSTDETILVVDDEAVIRDTVSAYLEHKGFFVLTAETGKEALEIFHSRTISFVILDLMLPDFSGEEVCTIIRRQSRIPIIMLTAKAEEQDLLNGLQIGADDYMTKPFSLKELYARMDVISRRAGGDTKPLAKCFRWNGGDLEADLDRRTIKKRGTIIPLTPIEWNLLFAFFTYPTKIFTRSELINSAFHDDFDSYDRVIDTHIKNLRKKIEDNPKKPVYIRTVHGIGYQFGGENG